ncbi:MAG: universal stress protein [Thermoplasmata archaeon]
MRKILIVYDGTTQSQKALEKGLENAKKDDVIIILHVVASAEDYEFSQIPPEVTISQSQRMMSELTSKLIKEGWNAIGVVRSGNVVDEILKIGSEMECDLIVIGDRGISKVSRFAVGKIAELVAKRSPRPVLVVR